MKATEAVRDIMDKSGVTLTTLANRTGKKVTVVWDRLDQKNISIEKLNELVRAMDYKVLLVPSGTRMADGFYEIE